MKRAIMAAAVLTVLIAAALAAKAEDVEVNFDGKGVNVMARAIAFEGPSGLEIPMPDSLRCSNL